MEAIASFVGYFLTLVFLLLQRSQLIAVRRLAGRSEPFWAGLGDTDGIVIVNYFSII